MTRSQAFLTAVVAAVALAIVGFFQPSHATPDDEVDILPDQAVDDVSAFGSPGGGGGLSERSQDCLPYLEKLVGDSNAIDLLTRPNPTVGDLVEGMKVFSNALQKSAAGVESLKQTVNSERKYRDRRDVILFCLDQTQNDLLNVYSATLALGAVVGGSGDDADAIIAAGEHAIEMACSRENLNPRACLEKSLARFDPDGRNEARSPKMTDTWVSTPKNETITAKGSDVPPQCMSRN